MKRNNWIICLFVFFFIFAEFFQPITAFTQDLGRHLKMGEIILLCHCVPRVNLFSYTYPNYPFINTHWLSEVVFYTLNHFIGLGGLLFVMSSIAAVSVVILVTGSAPYKILHTKYFIFLLPVLLSSGILLERTDLRPEIFSFFFVSVFMVILFRYRTIVIASKARYRTVVGKAKQASSEIATSPTAPRNDGGWKWLFLLPFLEILWVNMHIYFVIGPLLILLFLIDAIIQNIFSVNQKNPKHEMLNPKQIPNQKIQKLKHFWSLENFNFRFISNLDIRILNLCIVMLLCILATLINPNGIQGTLYPFTVMHNYGYTIAENQSLFFLLSYGFRHWSYFFFGMSVAILFILLLLNTRRSQVSNGTWRPIDWLLSITFTIIAISAIRNLPLFVFATLPTFLYLLPRHSEFNSESFRSRGPFGKLRTYSKPGMTLVFLFLIGLFVSLFISQNGLGYAITPGAEQAVDFLEKNDVKGPLFNNFDIGSYLDYRLYPKQKVFVDGRPEAYPASFFQNVYIPMQQDPAIFKTVEENYHFTTIFFSYTDQTSWAQKFIHTITQDSSWKLVYVDNMVMILVKDTPSNQDIIHHFLITQESPLIIEKVNTQEQLTHLALFFQDANWQDALIKTLQKIVTINPKNCQALGILANTSPQLYGQQFTTSCQ